MSWILAGAVLAVVAGGTWYLRWDAYRRGKLSSSTADLVAEIKLDAAKVTADSTESARIKALVAVKEPKARRAVNKYMETRVRVLSLPDSAGLAMRVTNAFEADTAIVELLGENRLLKLQTLADSTEKASLRDELYDTRELNREISKQSRPLCGMKCGITIGVVVVGAVAYLVK